MSSIDYSENLLPRSRFDNMLLSDLYNVTPEKMLEDFFTLLLLLARPAERYRVVH